MEQRTRFKIVIYLILLTIALILLGFWIWFAGAWQRDLQRVGDLKQIQSVMSQYYSRYGTYAISGCSADMRMSDCLSRQNGGVARARIVDPLASGYYDYLIGSLNDDYYEINFSFEIGVGGLPAGRYILTKDGVRR